MAQTSLAARNDYEQLLMDLHELETDAEKFYHKGNNTAGIRLRKGLLKLSRDISATRKKVTEIKKQRQAK